MSETIKPALTREEWEEAVEDARYFGGVVDDAADDLAARFFDYKVNGTPRHALAALALHGRPFGFDRLDVAGLREMASVHAEDNDELGALAKSMFDLAARIEALLPPEAK